MTQHQDTTQYKQNGKIHGQTTSPREKQQTYKQTMEILSANLQGELILPGDPAYEAERKVWNGSFDCYPAAIVRCANAEDVRATVNVAREQAMTLSVRSGGQSIPGHSTNNGGLVIDLSNMKTITIDPVRAASLDARTQPVFRALLPYANGAYVGFVADEGEQQIREVYPPATYDRLVALKHQYDPTNLFHRNQNIRPTVAPATLAAPVSS